MTEGLYLSRAKLSTKLALVVADFRRSLLGAGMLTGPAVIGFLSKGIGLHNAFWFLAALLACVPIFGNM
jgi:hypothetical protein